MKKIFLGSLALVLGLFALGASASSTTLFADSFESGNFNNWSTVDSGLNKWSVLPGLLIKAQDGKKDAEVSRVLKQPGTNWQLSKSVSTTGYNNLVLSFSYLIPRLGHLEANDHFVAEYFDGNVWQKVGDITNIDTSDKWQTASFNLLAGANDKTSFAFRLVAQFNPADKGLDPLDTILIDDVSLVGEPLPVVVDKVPPTIIEVYDHNTTATSTLITWGTDEPATGVVTLKVGPFGVDSVGRDIVSSSIDGLSHTAYIDGLTPGTEYYIRVKMTDLSGNSSIVYYNFTTASQ